MPIFTKLQADNTLKETILSLFAMDLDIEGAWGYTQKEATIIKSLSKQMPIKQVQHTLITMRCHLEMNMTLKDEKERYSAINANEISRESVKEEMRIYDKVTYKITAMKEDLYKVFIKEYKEGYENGLDLSEHFKRREEATLTREVSYYFEVGA
jgi:hypothetical protein